jgi:hypothetical protein
MSKQPRIKRRGFVMTGGGAKGLYEAGVITAFHLTGMEFDVISGSSIGAMNSIFFAEYLLRKKALPADVLDDPEEVIRCMDDLVRCYQRTWLLMPAERLIDDSENGSLGKLIGDLEKFQLILSDLVALGWWSMDPQKGKLPSVKAWPAISRLFGQLLQRLGGGSQVEGVRQFLRIWKDHRQNMLREILRTYLQNFRLEYAIIPSARDGQPGEDQKLEAMFTRLVSPLQEQHLSGPIMDEVDGALPMDRLLDPTRSLKDFQEKGIDVRLTRANYRTGRLEVSAYLSAEDFLRYMEKQAWRLEVSDPEKMPLGSFRLQLPGNPNAVKAALASGRFPGVFTPFAFKDIYPRELSENGFLYGLLDGQDWLTAPQVLQELEQAYFSIHGTAASEEKWRNLIARWQKSSSMREFFPYPSDTYVDGGAIDNTPSNSAVDATREWLDAHDVSRRDAVMELYVIFLETEPRIPHEQAQDPLLYEVVRRTLAIQSAAAKSSDAVVVNTINGFGERGDKLARSLLALLSGLELVREKIDPVHYQALEEAVRELVQEQDVLGYLGSGSEDILVRMKQWAEDVLANKLPLHVEEIKVYPDKMSLSTLQFTERLGYRKSSALEMMTMGCYNTLWAMRNHLENLSPEEMDAQDKRSITLARHWMGIENWPKRHDLSLQSSLNDLKDAWRCTRQECVFHAQYCQHGAGLKN